MKRTILAGVAIAFAIVTLGSGAASAVVNPASSSPVAGALRLGQVPMADSSTGTPAANATPTSSSAATQTSSPASTLNKSTTTTNSTSSTSNVQKTILGVPETAAYVIIGLLIVIAVAVVIGVSRSGGGGTNSTVVR